MLSIKRFVFILIIAVVGGSTTLWSQAPSLPMTSIGATAAADPETSSVRILVGRSTEHQSPRWVWTG